MSVDEKLRTGMRAWGDALDVDMTGGVPLVARRGHRRRVVAVIASSLTAIVFVAAWLGVAAALRSSRTHELTSSARPPVAKLEKASRDFARSYHVRERWPVASGTTSGAHWDAWAFQPQANRPCLAVDLGHGSCFVGFSSDNSVEFATGGTEPPAGGVFDVSGYTTPDVVRVRVDIAGRDPTFVQTVAVDGWPVRLFAVVLQGRVGDVDIRGAIGLGAAT